MGNAGCNGAKTYEALGKPLKGRKNIILTRQDDWKAEGTVAVKSFNDAVLLVKEMDVKEMMVIGGGEIFHQLLSKANRMYLTRVDASEGDAFFRN